MSKAMSRRNFIGVGLAGATIGLAGAMSACQPPAQQEASGNSASGQARGADHEGGAAETPWLGEPPVIAEEDIAETLEADIVIVGCGVAGMAAGLGAHDAGNDDILFMESLPSPRIAGGVHAGVNTTLQKEGGMTFTDEDIDKMIKSEIVLSSGYADERMYRVWARESGAVLDRLINLIGEEGYESKINTYPRASYDQKELEYFTEGEFPVGHNLGPGDSNEPCITLETALLEEAGAQFVFDTQATLLEQDDQDRVTGVIGKRADGSYVRANANKAVIVTCGSFGHNEAMVEALCPQVSGLGIPCMNPNTTDDGIGVQMMLWAGARMQAGPVAVMTKCAYLVPQPVPFLIVNNNGERFHNEGTSNFAEYNYVINQPGMTAWQVFDSNWAEACNDMGIMTWSNAYHVSEEQKKEIEDGCVRADTLEELAEAMGVPVDTFVATVERRNFLADAGHDDDFGLPIERLRATKIVAPPFFANESEGGNIPGFGVTLGGVCIDERMRVEGQDGRPIPGLYSAGNCTGRRFGSAYFQSICGMSNGFAATHGYVAGREAASL